MNSANKFVVGSNKAKPRLYCICEIVEAWIKTEKAIFKEVETIVVKSWASLLL